MLRGILLMTALLMGIIMGGEDNSFPIMDWWTGPHGNASWNYEKQGIAGLELTGVMGDGIKYYDDSLMFYVCEPTGIKLFMGRDPTLPTGTVFSNADNVIGYGRPNQYGGSYHFDYDGKVDHNWNRELGWQGSDDTVKVRLHRIADSMAMHINPFTSKRMKDHDAFYGYLVCHEDPEAYCTECYRAIESLCVWIKQKDTNPNHKTWAWINNLWHSPPDSVGDSLWDICQHLDVISFASYLSFSNNMPPESTRYVQERFDTIVARLDKATQRIRYNENRPGTKKFEWHGLITDWRYSRTFWNPCSSRRSTEEEMRCMAYLGLSRGAKGIIWLTYGSSPHGGEEDFYGFVSYPERTPYDETHPDQMYWQPPPSGQRSAPSYTWVKNINHDLQIVGPVFRTLTWDTATIVHSASDFDSLRYITAIEDGGTGGSTPFDSLYFELATYVDVADTDYFLIVNRQTLPTDTVCVSITVGGKYEGKKIWVIDQLTKEIRQATGGISNILVNIPPGDGKLFKIEEIPPWNSDFPQMTAFNNGRRLLSVPKRDTWTDLIGNLFVHELYSDGDSVYYTTKHPGLYYWTAPNAIGAGVYPALAVGRGIDCGDTLGWQMAACWVQKSENNSALYYAYFDQTGWHNPTFLTSSSSLGFSSPAIVVGRNYSGSTDTVHITYSVYGRGIDTVYYRTFPIISPPGLGRGEHIATQGDTIPPVIVIGFARDPLRQTIYSIPGIMWVSGGDIYGTIRVGGNWLPPVRVYDSPDNSVKSFSADVQGGNCYGTGEEKDPRTNKAKIRWGFGYVDALPGRFFGWVSPVRTVDSLIGLPAYPHISRGVAVTYQNPDSNDVFLRIWMPWDTGYVWTERQNLSNSSDTSRYPHTMVYCLNDTLPLRDSLAGDTISYIDALTIWTEGNNPYWIDSKLWSVYRGQSLLSAQKDTLVMPYYYLELGKESSTPFTAYRDTFVTAEPFAAADIGFDSLVYSLPFFEQNYNYGVMVELPHLADNTVILQTAQLEDTISLQGKGILKYHTFRPIALRCARMNCASRSKNSPANRLPVLVSLSIRQG